MDPRHERGRRGELLAARYLEQQGWRIEDRNWRAGHSELDLVARRGDIVAFIEVKTRSRPGCGDPLEWVTWRKRREVEAAARAWLGTRGGDIVGCHCLRFDAVAVDIVPGKPLRIRHLPDAWRLGDR